MASDLSECLLLRNLFSNGLSFVPTFSFPNVLQIIT